MPESSGMALSNFLKASYPPAEAPMPTTGKRLGDFIRAASIFGIFFFAFIYK
jgi:hypothetical protein